MDFTFLNWFGGIILVLILLAILAQLPALIWLFILAILFVGIKNAK